jgi:SusD/RagB-like outer membrane lipoprotein
MITRTQGIAAAILFSAGLSGCLDLDVVNENNPDITRALQQPAAVEEVIRSAFPIWYRLHGNNSDIFNYYPIISSEMSRTGLLRQMQPSLEPRVAFKNDPVADEVWIPRAPWDNHNSGLANAIDGLHRIMNDGLVIMTVNPGETAVSDNTVRARVYGKVMEGLQLGYIGLIMDRGARYTHEMTLPRGLDDLIAFERDNLKPYPEIIGAAVTVLEGAIADIDASPAFTLPNTWIAGQTYTSAQVRQFANSLIAKLLVYGARTPAERAAVNWQKILTHTEAGLTVDFGPVLTNVTGGLSSSYWTNLQSSTGQRANYTLIGPADTAGSYAAWVAKPVQTRDRFDVATPDRRITGPTATSNGAYFRYRTDNNGFDATRGTYNFSAYQWYRNNGVSNTGQVPVISATENRLLRAEALLRTGNAAEAANLINVSRTRQISIGTTSYPGLPAVTSAGVPESTGCVPRNVKTGVGCGTLMDALMYERGIELAGADPTRGWMDRRGFGQLVPGTILHMPIPARYLISLGIPLYTFGGVGGEGAAQ